MSKMKKDPEQETFQPVKKKFGPETQGKNGSVEFDANDGVTMA